MEFGFRSAHRCPLVYPQGFLRLHQDWYVPPDVAEQDASESRLLEASIPQVPADQVPDPGILPQGNGPGSITK
jgi:hypothetical protein